jgi:hypothetical protein
MNFRTLFQNEINISKHNALFPVVIRYDYCIATNFPLEVQALRLP